jgi:hypothetical protein
MKPKATNTELIRLWKIWADKYLGVTNNNGLFCDVLDNYSCLDCPYNSRRGYDITKTMDCKLYGNAVSDGTANTKEYKRVIENISKKLELI